MTQFREYGGSIRPLFPAIMLSLLLLYSCTVSNRTAQEAALEFMSLLSQGDFTEAALMASDDTAALVYLMERMSIASEGSGENPGLPIPRQHSIVEVLSVEEEGDGVRITLGDGRRSYVLYGFRDDKGWRIRMPREYW